MMFVSSAVSNNLSLPISVTVTAAVAASGDNIACRPLSPPPGDTAVPALDTPTITNIVLNALEGVQSGVPTRTTSTLTPTRLRSIEQIFELQLAAPEIHSNQAGFVPPLVQPEAASSSFISVDSKGWGGGVTTLTRSSSSSPLSNSSIVSSSQPLTAAAMPSLTTIQCAPNRRMGGRRPARDEKITPEEEERRKLRRERNKQAAARCRKRRLDQTLMLQEETENLEEKRSSLHQEIMLLQQQRDELEFLLAAHKTTCKKSLNSSAKVLSAVDNKMVRGNEDSTITFVKVKVEDQEEPERSPADIDDKPLRPTSLSLNLAKSKKGLPSDLGVTIETPSNDIRSLGLNFESMMDGGTGLTPIAATVAPISTGLTPLSTPIVSTYNTPVSTATTSCGTQSRSPDSVTQKLVLL